MIAVAILSLRLLAGQAELSFSVSDGTTNRLPTGRVFLFEPETRAVVASQHAWMNSTNAVRFQAATNSGTHLLRMGWAQSTNFAATFTYTSACPREVSFYCAGNLGRLTMTNGQAFNVALAYAALNGQLPCGQTATARDYLTGEVLASAAFPYPCDKNEYALTGGKCP